jgi:hypothetical protein
MSKRARDAWPNWKIAAVAIVCIAAGTALFLVYACMPAPPATATQPAPGRTPSNTPDPTQAPPSIGLGNLIVLMGLVSWAAGLTFAGWLGYRMYMRIPAWRRRQFFRRSP